MAKRVKAVVRLQIPAGKANPAPPIGTALGPQGVNIMAFCKEYNARTQDQVGMIIPAEITIYEDRSFTFITKTPPVSDLLKKATGSDAATSRSDVVLGVARFFSSGHERQAIERCGTVWHLHGERRVLTRRRTARQAVSHSQFGSADSSRHVEGGQG